jgi:hypothetical protein
VYFNEKIFHLFKGSARTFKDTLIVRYLCKVLPEVNRDLISQLKRGDNLNEVFTLAYYYTHAALLLFLMIQKNEANHCLSTFC